MKKIVLAVILMLGTAFSQNAKVIQLSPEDAIQSATLHKAVKDAEKAVEKFDKTVKKTYLPAPRPSNTFVNETVSAPEWFYGFEYSDDWKFIVPAINRLAVPGPISYNNSTWCGCPSLTYTSATALGNGIYYNICPSTQNAIPVGGAINLVNDGYVIK